MVDRFGSAADLFTHSSGMSANGVKRTKIRPGVVISNYRFRPGTAIKNRNCSVGLLLGESAFHRDNHVLRGLVQNVARANYEFRVTNPVRDKTQ
jgi:hypothetical protein